MSTGTALQYGERHDGPPLGFAAKPVLVFWESTRACPLNCVHCRASAISEPLPGELTTEEGFRLIDEVVAFGKPFPVIIFTGGDPLKRSDLFELLNYANSRQVGFAVSPAVSDNLTAETIRRIKESGAASISISLDGAVADTHDAIRRSEGTFDRTVWAIKEALGQGLGVQVNTVVMKSNFRELPRMFHLIKELGVKVWEVFFLVKVGRGTGVEDLSPEENEAVCHFLYDASRYGVTVRTVEAPFIRRVAKQRADPAPSLSGVAVSSQMSSELLALEGEPPSKSTVGPRGTLDGDGIIFVAYDGTIYPGGLLPVTLGNLKKDKLVGVYRDAPLLRKIRSRAFHGPCGTCGYSMICGGSRSRSYAYTGDPLSSDPACALVP